MREQGFWERLIHTTRPPRDLAVRMLRLLGWGITWAFRIAIGLRRLAYDRIPSLTKRVPRPVVSLGNLTFGGTGKTPAVEWLCREILGWGKRPLIVSRGYKRREDHQNEEALLLTEALHEVPHMQGPNRFRVASLGIEQSGPDCVVLDDGFQHRALHRDLDFVLVDATDPFGGGRLAPVGRLREPVFALARADGVIVTRSDRVSRKELDRILNAVAYHTKGPIALAVHRPVDLADPTGEPVGGLDRLQGVRAFLVSGIGNPVAFQKSAEALGAKVVGHRTFGDHHRYRTRDLDRVRLEAERIEAQVILTTQKDAVKIRFLPEIQGLPLWVLRVRFELVGGQVEELIGLIRKALGVVPVARQAQRH